MGSIEVMPRWSEGCVIHRGILIPGHECGSQDDGVYIGIIAVFHVKYCYMQLLQMDKCVQGNTHRAPLTQRLCGTRPKAHALCNHSFEKDIGSPIIGYHPGHLPKYSYKPLLRPTPNRRSPSLGTDRWHCPQDHTNA